MSEPTEADRKRGEERRDIRGESAWDAALALTARDLLTPAQFDTLYGPWRSVIESAPDTGSEGPAPTKEAE